MALAILSALVDEQVLHSNSLATVTKRWIVLGCYGATQSLISIAKVARLRTVRRTTNFAYPAFASGSLLITLATEFSKHLDGATLPFALVSLALLAGAQASRQASIAFVLDSEVVQTGFGTLREAASLVAAIRSAQAGISRREQPTECGHYSWLRAYIACFAGLTDAL
jgi:hypothetical protein